MNSRKVLFGTDAWHHGMLLLRVALGIAFIYHGYGKILNPAKWAWLGAQVPLLGGVETLAPILGAIAAIAEFFGGILLVIGLFVRPAALLIMLTMLVAANYHCAKGESFELPLAYAFMSLAVIFLNGDRFSLDKRFFHRDEESTIHSG